MKRQQPKVGRQFDVGGADLTPIIPRPEKEPGIMDIPYGALCCRKCKMMLTYGEVAFERHVPRCYVKSHHRRSHNFKLKRGERGFSRDRLHNDAAPDMAGT